MSYSVGYEYPLGTTSGSDLDLTFNGLDAPVTGYWGGKVQGYSHATDSKEYEEIIIDNADSSIAEKPVSHTWVQRVPGPVVRLSWQNGLSKLSLYRSLFWVGRWDSDGNVFGRPTMASLESVREDALASMLPSVTSGLSLVNFVLELKDVRRMFTVWDKRRNALGNLANAHLNLSFGWLPFFSDIASIVRSLQTLEQKLMRLERRAGKISTRRYRVNLPTDSDLTVLENQHFDFGYLGVPSATWTTWDPVKFTRVTRYSGRPVFHAKLVYRYTMPGASGVLRKVRAYLSTLGLNLDPSIVWNAIPFSFIVDWVLDVGKFLRSFSIDALDLRTEVLSFTSSVKWQIVHTVSAELPKDLTGGQYHSPIFCYQSTYGHYERSADIPSLTSVSTNNPGLRELALAGSLTSSTQLLPRWVKRALFESSNRLSRGENPLITVWDLIRAFKPRFAPNKLPRALRPRK
jgi:hypothetical protein